LPKLQKQICLACCLVLLTACTAFRGGKAPDQRISKYFTFAEAVHSDYAKKHNLINYPKKRSVRKNIERTAKRMDDVRDLLGRPIVVTSWYRSRRVNDAVGGSDTSAHGDGLAVDFYLDPENPQREFNKIANSRLSFDQLIYYPRGHRAHIGFRKKKSDERREIRRSGRR
jgi:uncharacterized protein YcbK (DUF882 family)